MSTGDRARHPADVTDTVIDMQRDQRRQRLASGPELEILEAFLNYQRDTLLWKVSGLNDDQLCKVWTPSGLCLLGIVKHLAYVEHNWFQGRFMGQGLLTPWTDDDPDADFRIEPDETTAPVIGFYRAQTAESSRIVAGADSAETMARDPSRQHSLRRIMVHMIEETARHNGHADILRELTDGQTGE
jgi:Protein of unknown function (DUF664)